MFYQCHVQLYFLTCKTAKKFFVNTCSRMLCMALLWSIVFSSSSIAQYITGKGGNDASAPLHLLKPDYPVPYGPTNVAAITEVLNRVHGYLEANTPAKIVNKQTGALRSPTSASSTQMRSSSAGIFPSSATNGA